jgi:hypothetical protein
LTPVAGGTSPSPSTNGPVWQNSEPPKPREGTSKLPPRPSGALRAPGGPIHPTRVIETLRSGSGSAPLAFAVDSQTWSAAAHVLFYGPSLGDLLSGAGVRDRPLRDSGVRSKVRFDHQKNRGGLKARELFAAPTVVVCIQAVLVVADNLHSSGVLRPFAASAGKRRH